MTTLLKLVETSKTLSLIFDFRVNDSRNKSLSIFLIVIRVALLILTGIPVFLLQAIIYVLYLQMFFTSLPGKLVQKTRLESLGYDDSNKWLFNISYLMLYLFVLIFEFAYIVINYLIVVLSFIMDCLIWILTLGQTKLVNTELSLNDKGYLDQSVENIDILAIMLTFVSLLLFNYIGEILLDTDITFVSWLYLSAIVMGLNTLFYILVYMPKKAQILESKTEDKASSAT